MLVYDVPTFELKSGDRVKPQDPDMFWIATPYDLNAYEPIGDMFWTLDMGAMVLINDIIERFGNKVVPEHDGKVILTHYRYMGNIAPETKYDTTDMFQAIVELGKDLEQIAERVTSLENKVTTRFPY